MLWITMTTNVSFFNHDRIFCHISKRGGLQRAEISLIISRMNRFIEVFKPLVQKAKRK